MKTKEMDSQIRPTGGRRNYLWLGNSVTDSSDYFADIFVVCSNPFLVWTWKSTCRLDESRPSSTSPVFVHGDGSLRHGLDFSPVFNTLTASALIASVGHSEE